MSIERQAAAGLKWSSLAKLLGQAVSWFITIAVFRLLSPEDYGLMALCMVFLSIVAGFAEFGLGSSLIQKQALEQRDLSRVAGALAALNIACGLLLALAAPLLAAALGDSRLTVILRVLCLTFLFNAFESVPYSLAYRRMDFKRLAGIELATTLVSAVVTFGLAWTGWGVWALVFGHLAAAALRTLLYVSLGGFVWPSFDLRGIAAHIRFGGTVTITRLLWQITSQADVLIAGRVFTRDLLGLYSVSVHLATLPMSKVMTIINQVAFPTVARLQDDLPRVRQRMLDALRMLALAAVPIMWGIAAVGPELVDVVLGSTWHPAIRALQIVSLITPLRMLQAVLATAVTGMGRADIELRNTIVGALILPLAFVIGSQYGLNGLAASWLVAIPLVFALNFPRTLPVVGFRFTDLLAAVRPALIGGVAMYLAVTATRLYLRDVSEALRLVPLVLIGGMVYLLTVRLVDRNVWTDVRRLATALRG